MLYKTSDESAILLALRCFICCLAMLMKELDQAQCGMLWLLQHRKKSALVLVTDTHVIHTSYTAGEIRPFCHTRKTNKTTTNKQQTPTDSAQHGFVWSSLGAHPWQPATFSLSISRCSGDGTCGWAGSGRLWACLCCCNILRHWARQRSVAADVAFSISRS